MKSFGPLLIALLLSASAANAHPHPITANPKPNAVLNASPTEIRIGFSEGLVAAFSGFELDDASGQNVTTGPATLNPNDDKELVAPISSKLGRGTYTVKWHAVGEDTHHLAGQYTFEVKP